MPAFPSVSAALLAATTLVTCAAPGQQSGTLSVSSPDHVLTMHFDLSLIAAKQDAPAAVATHKLTYSVEFRGKPVIDQSALALELNDLAPLGSDVQLVDSKEGSGVDDYTLTNSKVSKVHESYNSFTLRLVEPNGSHRALTIEARAYNSGVAFRYVLDKQEAFNDFKLKQEDTEFRLSTDATDWLLALPNYRSSYESEYVKLPTSALSNQGGVSSSFLIGMPLLMHEPGAAWLSLMEADIEGSSSMYVTNPSGNWAGHYFQTRLSPRFDDASVAVEGTLPYHSAWRVLSVADDPGRLVESNMLTNLNPPNRLTDTAWIKPGKASWNWWVDDADANGKPAFTTENMKRYVDFASESGLPYMMLDAGWSAPHDITRLNGKIDVPELCRYAATKNVKVWIWLYSTSLMEQMKEAFPLYEKWGVAGVKIDFINRDDQQGVQFYYDTAREAAANHIMVDFHGTRTPWGIERTYPNVMSYEAVLGMENNKVGRRDSPTDRSVFPFTRLLAGPMDYTAGAFNNATEDGYIAQNTNPMAMGTRAQQLALYVVFMTPFQMVSDSPQMYANQPAFQFIKDVPDTWDETRVLNGRPGEFATIARRHGSEWDLGSITDWTPRTLSVPLSFLGAGPYTAEIYEDAADAAISPKHVTIHKQTVRSNQTLTLKLAPGGGCAIRFVSASGH